MGNVGRHDLIREAQATIRAVLDPLIPERRRVALVEYPTHHNVGDQAIWLGETRYLAQRGCTAIYYSDRFHFSAELLKRRLRPGDLILLHGGGNLGDVHPAPEILRETVLRAFTDHPVVQLPQTIHFSNEQPLERARAAVDAHPDFTLLTRDHVSQAFAESSFACRTVLVPDMAFMLGNLERPKRERRDVVWLARTDQEAAGTMRGVQSDLPLEDWSPLRPQLPRKLTYLAARWAHRALGRYAARRDAPPAAVSWASCRLFDPVATRHLRRGVKLLGSARVVVTDRLHAHVLCLLMGVPHVVLNNSYGKLSSYLSTWTGESDLTHVAADIQEAKEIVHRILEERAT